MSGFSPSPVRIVRKQKTKTASLSYQEAEADVPGSPFMARFYRKRQNSMRGRDESPAGQSDVNIEQVVSLPSAAPVAVGDVILLPPGTAGLSEVRAKILRVRLYPTGIQCDVETGAV